LTRKYNVEFLMTAERPASRHGSAHKRP
jgi:hypothetical protein